MARIGLMGCGSVANFGHLPAISVTEGLELVALYDPSRESLESTAKKFPVAVSTTSSDEFFAQDLDAVVICSPAFAHLENVLECAARKLHVLCEKPLAMNDDDAEVMIRAMEKADRKLLVGFVYRFSPVAEQIHQWAREKVIGDILSLRLTYVWDLHGQYTVDKTGEWIESPMWRGRMLEGGPLVDCGVHQIDLAEWWLGSPAVRWSGHGSWVANYEAPDHCYLHMDHANGAHTLVEVSFSYGHTVKHPAPQFTYQLIGSGGVISYDRNGWRLELRNGQNTLTAPGASEKNFYGMHAAFSRVLATGEVGDFPTGREGLRATQIARMSTEAMIRDRIPPRSADPSGSSK